jgi:predicted signal transduction protein with EAL and GGDEF domain
MPASHIEHCPDRREGHPAMRYSPAVMTTTAEGVETHQQKEILRGLGCTEMQGYLFSAAKPGPEVRRLFGTRTEISAAVA